ncbi:MAG: hypothetical protein ACT6FE_06700 [Methanosarcinaceae archaeon]
MAKKIHRRGGLFFSACLSITAVFQTIPEDNKKSQNWWEKGVNFQWGSP